MTLQEAVDYVEAHVLTAKQASEETGISQAYVHQLARKNAPESEVIILGKRFISRAWLTHYIQNRTAREAKAVESKVSMSKPKQPLTVEPSKRSVGFAKPRSSK